MWIEHHKRLAIIILALLSLMIGLNYWTGNQRRHTLDDFSSVFINALDLAISADRDLYQAHTACQNYLMTIGTNPVSAQQELNQFEQNARQALERMRTVSKLLAHSSPINQQMGLLESDYIVWLNSAKLMFRMANTNQIEQARQYSSGLLNEHFILLRAHYDTIGELVRELADAAGNQE